MAPNGQYLASMNGIDPGNTVSVTGGKYEEGVEYVETEMSEYDKLMQVYDDILANLHNIYVRKNSDYGNSFDASINEFGYSAGLIRMYDKLSRLISLYKKDPSFSEMKVSESIEDTLLDLANYAIMFVSYIERQEPSL